MLEYDLQQREAATKSSRTAVQPTFTASQYRALSVLSCGHTSSTKCYGCASAVTEHCITLLRALASNPALRHILVSQGLIRELFDYNLRRGSAAMREEVRQLMCLLTRSEPACNVVGLVIPADTRVDGSSDGNTRGCKELCFSLPDSLASLSWRRKWGAVQGVDE